MAYDYQAAISAGANPNDVMNYMATQHGYDVKGAINAGAKPEDIMNYLGSNVQSPQTPTPQQDYQTAKSKSDYLNSPTGLATETAKGTAKSLLGGALTFFNSAVRAPVDLVRGVMGKAPLNDNPNYPTIQSQAYTNAGKVYEGQMTPIQATTDAVGQTVGGAADILGGEGLLKGGIKLGEAGISKAESAYGMYKDARAVKTAAGEAAKITDMISPKPTVKEARLATTQGRFVEGKRPTLFKAGTEDTIKPSQKTMSASQTIQQNIPNASRMSPSELYTAVDKNITDTATKLRPQMEATPIKPETIDKINSDWQALKKSQIADAPATEEANVAKRQAKFESLLKKSGNKNHADLWDTAIRYDQSVPDNVKRATSLSPESLQLQKQEWLDNRQVLSDALEKSSKPEFKAMSDMYNAKTGLLSKAKVEGAQMSKINQFLKDNPKTAKILGGATIYEIAKHSGIPLP